MKLASGANIAQQLAPNLLSPGREAGYIAPDWLSELFSGVLCNTIVHSYKHTHMSISYRLLGTADDLRLVEGFLCVFVSLLIYGQFILCLWCIL